MKSVQLIDFKPIMEALDTLHSLNYVHSDVRMENIVFSENGAAKLIELVKLMKDIHQDTTI